MNVARVLFLIVTGSMLALAVAAGPKGFNRLCPPFDQCTPVGDWNSSNCKCWSHK